MKTKIGIIREGKTPPDNRVAFSPKQCKEIQEKFTDVQLLIQPSPHRCFTDNEYLSEGLLLQEDLSDCDILFGVKEVPKETLIPNKTYFFFSHTKKKQAYNQGLMHTLISKKIKLVDYECLTFNDGQRILGFGYWAGIVGAHNGLLTFGKKNNLFELKKVHNISNFQELKESYEGLQLPNIKIALTGTGRVSKGVIDIMQYLDIKQVSKNDFLYKTFEYPVFVQLKGEDIYARKDDSSYDRNDFHKNASEYCCTFLEYTAVADILMNGGYWDKNIPRLFEIDAVKNPAFKMNVIADITCDVNGSVPCTLDATTIQNPVFGFNKTTFEKEIPFQNNSEIIDIMAVDNLPNELPRDASRYFGSHLMLEVLPHLLEKTNSNVIEKATICQNGKLITDFEYLSDYAYV